MDFQKSSFIVPFESYRLPMRCESTEKPKCQTISDKLPFIDFSLLPFTWLRFSTCHKYDLRPTLTRFSSLFHRAHIHSCSLRSKDAPKKPVWKSMTLNIAINQRRVGCSFVRIILSEWSLALVTATSSVGASVSDYSQFDVDCGTTSNRKIMSSSYTWCDWMPR